MLALMLIPVGVSISVVGYQLSTILKLPIFVDQIGIRMVGMIAGPWVGLVTGLLSNVVNGMLNPTAFGFALVSMVIGFMTGMFSRWKWYTNFFGILAGCFLIYIASSMTSAVVTVFMFGGVTGAGTDLITATLLATGQAMWKSVLSTNLISGAFNTIINFGASWIIVKKIPDRFLVKLNYGLPYIKQRRKNK